MPSIRVPVGEDSIITGRNGTFYLTAVELWWTPSGGNVYIDGIGRRGRAIRGGLSLDPEAMDELSIEWLRQRGKLEDVRDADHDG